MTVQSPIRECQTLSATCFAPAPRTWATSPIVPENSRRFRALPAWMVLAAYGPDGISAAVERTCAHARELAEGIGDITGLQLLDPVRLNIVCFAPNGNADVRDALLQWLVADGRIFLTPTVLQGRPALRLAVSNWRTEAKDVQITLQALREAVEALGLGKNAMG